MLIFSKHALKRMSERKIDSVLVEKTVEYPTKLENRDGENRAVKLFGDKVLVVVYSSNNDVKFIITLWESNKIGKYLH